MVPRGGRWTMTDPQGFLSRWSRRKRESAVDAEPAHSSGSNVAEPPEPDASANLDPCVNADLSEDREYDPKTLPPIDSITAETDVRGFLAPGVPAALRDAALRRTWSADPKIRDFVGLADYDWDFNAPGSMHGFGPLEITEALRRFMAGGASRQDADEPPTADASSGSAGPASPAGNDESGERSNADASRRRETMKTKVKNS
jgi:hypothetical protein